LAIAGEGDWASAGVVKLARTQNRALFMKLSLIFEGNSSRNGIFGHACGLLVCRRRAL
jgi:hypothetical protein